MILKRLPPEGERRLVAAQLSTTKSCRAALLFSAQRSGFPVLSKILARSFPTAPPLSRGGSSQAAVWSRVESVLPMRDSGHLRGGGLYGSSRRNQGGEGFFLRRICPGETFEFSTALRRTPDGFSMTPVAGSALLPSTPERRPVSTPATTPRNRAASPPTEPVTVGLATPVAGSTATRRLARSRDRLPTIALDGPLDPRPFPASDQAPDAGTIGFSLFCHAIRGT